MEFGFPIGYNYEIGLPAPFWMNHPSISKGFTQNMDKYIAVELAYGSLNVNFILGDNHILSWFPAPHHYVSV